MATDIEAPGRRDIPNLPVLDFLTTFDYEDKDNEKPRRDQPTTSGHEHEHKEEDQNNETFSFRLFAPHSQNASNPAPAASRSQSHHDSVTRICIRSPTPLSSQEGGGFKVPFRPRRYYFTSAADEEDVRRKRTEYANMAMTGEEVISMARRTIWVRLSLYFLFLPVPGELSLVRLGMTFACLDLSF